MDSNTTAGGDVPLQLRLDPAMELAIAWAIVGCLVIGVVVSMAFVIKCLLWQKEQAAVAGGRAPQQQPAAPAVEAVAVQVAGEDDAAAAPQRPAVEAAPPAVDVELAQEPVLECTFRTEDGWEDTMCSMCLSDMADGDTVRVLTACTHSFHATCVEQWLREHATCPLCRAPSGAAAATKGSEHRSTTT